jgi:hypothetical protein
MEQAQWPRMLGGDSFIGLPSLMRPASARAPNLKLPRPACPAAMPVPAPPSAAVPSGGPSTGRAV